MSRVMSGKTGDSLSRRTERLCGPKGSDTNRENDDRTQPSPHVGDNTEPMPIPEEGWPLGNYCGPAGLTRTQMDCNRPPRERNRTESIRSLLKNTPCPESLFLGLSESLRIRLVV